MMMHGLAKPKVGMHLIKIRHAMKDIRIPNKDKKINFTASLSLLTYAYVTI
jgi:hypothetical protein